MSADETAQGGKRPTREGPDPWLGQVLDGRYRVLSRLAEGGMGAVYVGEQIALSRKVAIKLLHAHLARDEEIVTRFRREALATTKIGHPHIVEVVDLGELADGTLFMVLELLEGRDLARLLKDVGPLSVGRAARIVSQVASAVQAAHDKSIVHRDLKPENVFLVDREDGADFVKVLDFGVSKIRDLEGIADTHTRTGTAIGTPYYMAPEQAQGRKEVDHRADVYALGVILFRLLTGYHPFDDPSYPVLIVMICTEDPPPLSRWRSDLPAPLIALIERMLSKNPKDRPASAREVEVALGAFCELDAPAVHTGSSAPTGKGASLLEARSGGGTPRDHSPAAFDRTVHASTSRSPEEIEEDEKMAESVVGKPRTNPALVPLLVVGALATALVVGYAIYGSGDVAAPRETFEEAALPEPRAPVVRALRARGDGEGWSWVNPRPRSMPTWQAVAVGGPDMVGLVGHFGVAARFSRGLLVTWRTGVTSTLRAAAWAGTETLLVAGDEGVVLRLGSREVSRVDVGTDASLRAALCVSGTEALVAGDGGLLLRITGDAVSRVDLGTDASLLALHARAGSVWAVGERGTIVRLDGDRRAAEDSGTDATLRAVGGCPRGNVYAGGDADTLLQRRASGAWSTIVLPRTGESITAISCDAGRAVAVGNRGSIRLIANGETVLMPSGFDEAWHGVSGGPDQTTWVVGAGGRFATLREDHVQTATDGPIVPLRDIGTIGGALVAVGEWGRIVRERESGLELVDSPTDSGLASLAALDEGSLVAVGDDGAVLVVRYDGVELLSSPTQASLRSVIAGPDGHLIMVGTQGTLLRGTLYNLSASRIPDAGDLHGLAGTPDDALVVGDGGFVAHLSSAGATRWPCDLEANFRALVRLPEGNWAVAQDGIIARVSASGCVEEHRGGPSLEALGVGPDGALLAAGEFGAALTRSAEGQWTPLDLELGGAAVRRVRRLGRHVYLAGASGAIVRHIVVDGS